MHLHNKEKIVLLLLNDVAAIILAFAAAIALGHRLPFSFRIFWFYGWGLLVLIFSVLIVFFILDFYSLRKMSERFLKQIFIAAMGFLFSSVLAAFIFYFVRNIAIPRAVFLIFFPTSLCLIVTSHYLYSRLFITFIYWRVLIVGEKKISGEMAELINSRKYLHSHVVGYMSNDKDTDSSQTLKFLGNADNLPLIVTRENIDQLIVAYKKIDEKTMKLLLGCMQKKVQVTDFKKVIEEIAGKVPIEHLDNNWFILQLSTINKRYFWYAKRLTDIVLSFIGLCIVIPFLPVIALLIKLDSRGPVFYSQMRIGKGGKPFRVWKLRTMAADADKNNVYWTTEKDSRITRLGKALRKIRLDELPQFINILKGDMSFIGPRPEAVSLSELYAKEIPYYSERHMVTPGITGWAQINYRYGNSVEDAKEKLKYDFYYIKNRSLMLDVVIFLRTIRIVLTGKGAI